MMKKSLSALAIAVAFGLGTGTLAQATPIQTLGYSAGGAEVQQIGFKKKFKHRGHFRHRGFGHRGFKHRRFRHGGFHRGRFLDRGLYKRDHGHSLRLKDGRLINKNGKSAFRKHQGYKDYRGHGVVRKKIITPFGIILKR